MSEFAKKMSAKLKDTYANIQIFLFTFKYFNREQRIPIINHISSEKSELGNGPKTGP